jgi:hypothetical protein
VVAHHVNNNVDRSGSKEINTKIGHQRPSSMVVTSLSPKWLVSDSIHFLVPPCAPGALAGAGVVVGLFCIHSKVYTRGKVMFKRVENHYNTQENL